MQRKKGVGGLRRRKKKRERQCGFKSGGEKKMEKQIRNMSN